MAKGVATEAQQPLVEPESLSSLFARARDEGKAWAQAEADLYRTIAMEKLRAWQTPLVLLGAALFLGHASLLVAVATLFVALGEVINPALAGLVTMAILSLASFVLVRIALAKFAAIGR